MNRWGIPAPLESEIVERDGRCVYCGVEFGNPHATKRDRPSWEHIVNDAGIKTRENIARCCVGCNASKGAKSLSAWLTSKYCRVRGINCESVALVVKNALAHENGGPDVA